MSSQTKVKDQINWIESFSGCCNFNLTTNSVHAQNVQLVSAIISDKETIEMLEEDTEEGIAQSKRDKHFEENKSKIKSNIYKTLVLILPYTTNNKQDEKNNEENDEKKSEKTFVAKSKYWTESKNDMESKFSKFKESLTALIVSDSYKSPDLETKVKAMMNNSRTEIKGKVHIILGKCHTKLNVFIEECAQAFADDENPFDSYSYYGFFREQLTNIIDTKIEETFRRTGTLWTEDTQKLAIPKIKRLVMMNELEYIKDKKQEIFNKCGI
eukprot:88539_1